MWILTQINIKNNEKTFKGAINYDKLISYINKFENVRKIDDYNFENYKYQFILNLVDMLDWRDIHGKH